MAFFGFHYGPKAPAREQSLDHAPLHLDGVQLRGVRGQEHQPDVTASRLHKPGNRLGLVARGVVQNHNEFGAGLEQILQEPD